MSYALRSDREECLVASLQVSTLPRVYPQSAAEFQHHRTFNRRYLRAIIGKSYPKRSTDLQQRLSLGKA
jgi:hypothetical protein